MKLSEKQWFFLKICGIVTFIIACLIIAFTICEPIDEKIERTCNIYDMKYVYRGGQNCLDKKNVLHPIITECPMPWKRGTCEITFIIPK